MSKFLTFKKITNPHSSKLYITLDISRMEASPSTATRFSFSVPNIVQICCNMLQCKLSTRFLARSRLLPPSWTFGQLIQTNTKTFWQNRPEHARANSNKPNPETVGYGLTVGRFYQCSTMKGISSQNRIDESETYYVVFSMNNMYIYI